MPAPSRWRAPASLGAKLVLFLTAAGLTGALAITVLLAAVITPSFDRLAAQDVRGQVERTRAMLAADGTGIARAAQAYREWNGGQAAMAPMALAEPGVDGLVFLAIEGDRITARWRGSGTTGQARTRAVLLAAIGELDRHPARSAGGGYFFVRSGGDIAVIGYAQGGRGELVLMTRLLSARAITDALRLDARLDAAPLADVEVATPSRGWADVRVPIAGIDGRPIAAVRFTLRRDVALLGRRMLLLAVAGSTVLLLIILVVLRRMIARQVLAPLHRVEAHMGRVRASGSMIPLEEDGRRDEIGALGRAFNAMLRQLNDLREQIQAQSFALGRSESAVAVMHNVRNALNPVSTILSQGIAQAAPVDRAMLDRALVELAGDDLPAPRRAKLAAFVATGVDAWAASRDAMRAELTVGREAMAHALEIIGQQQQRAHERPPLEPCDVTEIIARNATIARYSELASIAFSFPSASHRVLANRVILSQVIGNLFGNAAEAIAAGGRGSGTISVAVAQEGETIVVRIRDDGEGFDAATGRTLFERGFSTRAHKSGGLGLHWCANSMTAMGGSLRLDSAGKGNGAVAVLKLKAVEAMRAAA